MRMAVLTSGGDAPGMNAGLRAVVRAGLDRGFDVVGIRRGYAGIFDDGFEPMDRRSIVNIVQRGGTVLGTSRCPRLRTDAGLAEAVQILRRQRIDAMVLIGGDGTFRGGAALEAAGGPATVGVPGTIDNDVPGSETSLGFDTAVNTAVEAIDRIRDTATSHEVLHFVEVMGRHCGAIALAAAVAGGAEAVLVPEAELSDRTLAARIDAEMRAGKRSVIVVLSEGAREGSAEQVAANVAGVLGLEHRLTVLGHIQRGGSPSAADRILGALFGLEAVDAVAEGARGCYIGQRSGAIVRIPYGELDGPPVGLDQRLVRAAHLIS
ncbi:MAG: ATP-dependent 6-phosphofructokinase [Acidimicrobiales bacterium]|nr:ATP-dependent 6-phosphofructokinase [Acidimicrobiales bacterium]